MLYSDLYQSCSSYDTRNANIYREVINILHNILELIWSMLTWVALATKSC